MKTFTSLLDVMMKILLITFLLFPETILGEHHLTCPQTIEAAEGDDVNIQCRLDPPVNLSDYTLDVARLDLGDDDGDVYCYRHGKDHLDDQMDRYRGRTTLNHEDLIRGNMRLKISSVNLSDRGNYIVFLKKLRAHSVINITVVSKDQANRTKRTDSSTSGPPVEEETESDHRGDGENRKTARAVILPSVLLLWILLVLLLKSNQNRTETIKQTDPELYREAQRKEGARTRERPEPEHGSSQRPGEICRKWRLTVGNLV
ncbi:V-set domain-containing T-cell activation inhibitor 1-like [Sander lucioperca]|uniref:V-set domain-containing T-cell activation inhibitor 1-like n=1 Tax=Sander lucioperca TaxID=283035 RepID=UPI0016539AC9|nr:V-set domain-containing T-cell activation inhibitor 1-like [Sander lucioperca]